MDVAERLTAFQRKHLHCEAIVLAAAEKDPSMGREECQRLYEEAAVAYELAQQKTKCIECGRPCGDWICAECYVFNKL